MNNRFLTITPLLACSSLFIAGCSDDNNSFETPNTSSTPTNAGIVSQNNFTILAADLEPVIFADPAKNTFTFTKMTITVRVGDRENQILTDAHTVLFKTEWGLIDPSCVTENGSCTVTWQTSSGDTAPADHKNTILAYTLGEESFTDVNGNAIFDDGDNANPAFDDLEEPFVDSNRNRIYDNGEPIADVINGNDQTGINGVHDIGDTFFNGQNCTHSSLCSTIQNNIYVWDDVQLSMDGPPPAAP